MTLQVFARIGDITGDGELVGFEGAIEVVSYTWGLSTAAGGDMFGGGGAGRPQPQDVAVSLRSSSASPRLFLACATGRHFPEATIEVARVGSGPEVFARFRLQEVRVTSFVTSGADGTDAGVDSITLDYRRLTSSYARQRPDDTLDTPVVAGFDFAGGVEL